MTDHYKTIEDALKYGATWGQPIYADALAALCELQAASAQKPVFWYRPVGTDGGYEGPIHDGAIESVRKASGVWKQLYTAPSIELVQQARDALNRIICVYEGMRVQPSERGHSDWPMLQDAKVQFANLDAWLEANK